jgi:hypothetical protein
MNLASFRRRVRFQIIRYRKRITVLAPELLGTIGAVVITAATYQVHPIAGWYVAGFSVLAAGVVIAMGRRPS